MGCYRLGIDGDEKKSNNLPSVYPCTLPGSLCQLMLRGDPCTFVLTLTFYLDWIKILTKIYFIEEL